MTLHQLRIFWAVAHAKSFTKASKLLGLAQPSLSQQISKLEEDVGALLFNRNRNEMKLTDAGIFLARKTELILSSVEEATVGLKEFSEGTRGVIAIGALSSIARNLIPQALHELAATFPDIEVDIHETAPAEALDLLYGRRLTMAMLATDSIASSASSFHQTEIVSDQIPEPGPTAAEHEGDDGGLDRRHTDGWDRHVQRRDHAAAQGRYS